MDLLGSDRSIESENYEVTEQLLPIDLNDEFYLINCFVCQEVAKSGQVSRIPNNAINFLWSEN